MRVSFIGDFGKAEFQKPKSLRQRFSNAKSRVSQSFGGKKKRSLTDNALGTTTKGRVARIAGAGTAVAAGALLLRRKGGAGVTRLNPKPRASGGGGRRRLSPGGGGGGGGGLPPGSPRPSLPSGGVRRSLSASKTSPFPQQGFNTQKQRRR